MRLLLDTHALIWFLTGDSKLSAMARNAIEDSRNLRYVSHATAWEIAVKYSLRKLDLMVPYTDIFPKAVFANGFQLLSPKLAHYVALLDMPYHHRDPFDRLIIAQSISENLTLVTRDSEFANYGVPTLW